MRVPLDPSLAADELANQVRDAEARVLLHDAPRAALAKQVGEGAGAGVDLLAIDAVLRATHRRSTSLLRRRATRRWF